MVYYAYGSAIKFIQVLNVSSVENIEIEYKDADMDAIKGVYSITLGGREYIGDEIRWDEEGSDNFKIYNNGRNIHNDSDTEEDEEDDIEEDLEEEEEEEEEEEVEEEDQDDFTNRMCENGKCNKEFDLTEPHYYDEEQCVCYCCKECFDEDAN
jgi:hypothetical protein